MTSPGSIILGIIFILLGIYVFKKSPSWVDRWWKLSDNKGMIKIFYKSFAIFLFVFGILALFDSIK